MKFQTRVLCTYHVPGVIPRYQRIKSKTSRPVRALPGLQIYFVKIYVSSTECPYHQHRVPHDSPVGWTLQMHSDWDSLGLAGTKVCYKAWSQAWCVLVCTSETVLRIRKYTRYDAYILRIEQLEYATCIL